MLIIRSEEPKDYEIVEEITRNAFYNLYMPGCVEHYLVHQIDVYKRQTWAGCPAARTRA